jgi:sulfur-carrier protein
MVTVFIPPQLRDLTAGAERVTAAGATVRQVVNSLESQFPGIRDRLCDADGLRSGINVAINGTISSHGLLQKTADGAEIHFLPAIGGG